MSPLKVGADQTAIAQRGCQAFVPQEAAHLVEPRTTAQPAGGREMPQRVGVQPSVYLQAGLCT